MGDVDVSIVGAQEFMNDVRRASAERGAIETATSQAALGLMNPVAGVTRSVVPHGTGGLASDVRVNKSRSGATIRMGSPSVRYAGWVDFGGHRRAPHESARDYNPQGRFLFPSARPIASRVSPVLSTAVGKAFDGFQWSHTGE